MSFQSRRAKTAEYFYRRTIQMANHQDSHHPHPPNNTHNNKVLKWKHSAREVGGTDLPSIFEFTYQNRDNTSISGWLYYYSRSDFVRWFVSVEIETSSSEDFFVENNRFLEGRHLNKFIDHRWKCWNSGNNSHARCLHGTFLSLRRSSFRRIVHRRQLKRHMQLAKTRANNAYFVEKTFFERVSYFEHFTDLSLYKTVFVRSIMCCVTKCKYLYYTSTVHY